MTEQIETEIDEIEQVSAEVQKPGELLREKREASDISCAVVAEALHLTVHYVKSLENDDYSKLPGLTFVKGYIKSYARFLNMDADLVLQCYETYVQELGDLVAEKEQSSRIRRRNDQVIVWAIAAGITLVLGLVLGWWFFGRAEGIEAAQINVPDNALVASSEQAPNAITQKVNDDVADAAIGTALVEPANLGDQIDEEIEGSLILADVLADAAISEAEQEVEIIEDKSLETVLDAPSNDDLVVELPQASVEPSMPANEESTVEEVVESYSRSEDGTRRVELNGPGDDSLQLSFKGTSWVEVADAEETRLYNDLMTVGDELIIQGSSPFYVLLGDASQIELRFNAREINIDPRIRVDKTARFQVSDAGLGRWVVP